MDDPKIGRRGVLFGAGATALAATLAGTDHAAAEPRHRPKSPFDKFDDEAQPSLLAAATPSKPKSGYVYRSASFLDFHTLGFGSERTIGAVGAYENTAIAMSATVDLPAVALIRDVEFYFLNNSAGELMRFGAEVWSPGVANGDLDQLVYGEWGSSSAMQTHRLDVPIAQQGPYPAGAKLLISFLANGNPDMQMNGARVGLIAGGAISMRSVPYRAYDTRTAAGGILTGGTHRAVTFAASVTPPGTSAVIVNLTAVGASANGFLRAYATDVAMPTTSSLNFTASGDAIANALPVGISAARQLSVYTSTTCHFIVDVLGTIS